MDRNKKQYRAVFDGDSFIDGEYFDTFEEAKDAALECLSTWHAGQMSEMKSLVVSPDGRTFYADEDDIEEYDYMIECLMCWVETRNPDFNPDTDDEDDEYIECWSPSEDDLNSVGWQYWFELGGAVTPR